MKLSERIERLCTPEKMRHPMLVFELQDIGQKVAKLEATLGAAGNASVHAHLLLESLEAELEKLREKGRAFMLADWNFEGGKIPHQYDEFRDALKDT